MQGDAKGDERLGLCLQHFGQSVASGMMESPDLHIPHVRKELGNVEVRPCAL